MLIRAPIVHARPAPSTCLEHHHGMIPTDARYKNRRDLTSADRMPYHLTKVVPQNAVDCGARRTIRDNILWQYRGDAPTIILRKS